MDPLIPQGRISWAAARDAINSHADAIANVKRFGAVGDGTTDDTRAIQAAMDSLRGSADIGGGIVFFPNGLYKVAGTLLPRCCGLTLTGTGHRSRSGSISSFSDADANVASTLLSTGPGPMIRLDTATNINAFSMFNMTLHGDKRASDKVGIQFVIQDSQNFRRDFTFQHLTIEHFGAAFELSSNIADFPIGMVRIENCRIASNHSVWRPSGLVGYVNNFTFNNNDAGNNGYDSESGGIDLSGLNIVITGNILESNRNAIKISNASRNIVIQGNYFEDVPGTGAIVLNGNGGMAQGIIGPNFYSACRCDYKARAVHDVGITYLDPVMPKRSVMPRLRGFRASGTFDSEGQMNFPSDTAAEYSYIVQASICEFDSKRSITWPNDRFIPNAREQWIDGSILAAAERTVLDAETVTSTFAVSANTGDWVVATMPLRYIDTITDPYTELRINDSAAATNGSVGGDWVGVSQCPTDEWMILLLACRARVSVTSVVTYLQPFGSNSKGAKRYRFMRPSLHIVPRPELISPAIDVRTHQSVAAPPTSGTWRHGDVLYHSAPIAGGIVMFVCTKAGSPGTWNVSGRIEP